jgi:hypothetical protein
MQQFRRLSRILAARWRKKTVAECADAAKQRKRSIDLLHDAILIEVRRRYLLENRSDLERSPAAREVPKPAPPSSSKFLRTKIREA